MGRFVSIEGILLLGKYFLDLRNLGFKEICLDMRNRNVREIFLKLRNPNGREDLSRFKES